MTTKAIQLLLCVFSIHAYAQAQAQAPSHFILSIKSLIHRMNTDNIEIEQRREIAKQAWDAHNFEQSRNRIQAEVHVSWSHRKATELVGAANETPIYQTIGPYSKKDAKAFLSTPIWDPAIRADVKTAKLRAEIEDLTLALTQEQILAATLNTYFQYINANDSITAARSAIQRDKELLALATSLYTAGASDKIDLIRAELKLADDEELLIQVNNQARQQELQLKRLINLPINQPLTLISPSFATSLSLPDIETLYTAAIQTRPDYLRSLAEIEKDETIKKSARNTRLPSLSFYGEYSLAEQAYKGGKESSEWQALFLVSMPIWDSKKSGSKISTAKSRIRSAKLEQARVEQELTSDLAEILSRIESLQRQLILSEKKENLAQERYRLSLMRFENGVADNQEAVEATLQLSLHQLNRANTHYLYHRALLDLASVQGNVSLLIDYFTPSKDYES